MKPLSSDSLTQRFNVLEQRLDAMSLQQKKADLDIPHLRTSLAELKKEAEKEKKENI